MKKSALVLSGGGARGAYQVGVLSAVSQIFTENNIENPFKIYTGVSAGAINASYLAAESQDFHEAVKGLVKLWGNIQSENVFHSDALNIGKIGLKWMSEVSFGAITGSSPGKALLDTSPLEELISKNLNFSNIQKNIDQNHLEAVAITAVDYNNSKSITFTQGKTGIPQWTKARRKSELTELRTAHILASSAIPLLFPPIEVDQRYFGDGCVRNSTPCSPSIHLGAEKILVIGVRQEDSAYTLQDSPTKPTAPNVGRVMNTLLNAVLLDGIENDIERLQRINQFVDNIPEEHRKNSPFKKVDFVWISPSQDIGELASQNARRLPKIIRYLLKGLGNTEETSEIISYLLFDPVFCSELIEMGYKDGLRHKEEIIKTFSSP